MDNQEHIILNSNTIYLNEIMRRRVFRILARVSPYYRRMYREFRDCTSIEDKNYVLVKLVNAFEESALWRGARWLLCFKEDMTLSNKYKKQRVIIDRSNLKTIDYYSVVVIVKNEARYMKEYILFYRATGADRIYVYDNESTDNLLDVLEPFINSGFVIYRYWPGEVSQTAAYRDAIRRTKNRTKWLAIVDADEFLFSPKGNMKEQLKAYEDFPGVGANWVVFGSNGHDKRPAGLVIDNYTTTFANDNEIINRHIKSIVQPRRVFTIHHTHYAVYRGRHYAVDEEMNLIDNTYALLPCAGKAFTKKNNRSIFRINHYQTRSLEDLRDKCARGYADGAPNRDYNEAIKPFNELPLKEDRVITELADIVRKTVEIGK